MAWFFALPINARLTLLFILGLVIGGQVNRAIYRLAWTSRSIGPWSKPHQDAPRRKWFDRIPVLGWFSLSREEPIHGILYWLRPMLIELGMAIGFAMLYQWELQGGLHNWTIVRFPFPALSILHAEYLSHIVLITLMLAATFIDFDEKTIPDGITIPGTMVGIVLATVLPNSLLPAIRITGVVPKLTVTEPFLDFSIPFPWNVRWDGVMGLSAAILCLIGWWYAVLPKRFYFHLGLVQGLRLSVISLWRRIVRPGLMLLHIILMAAVAWTVIAWMWGGPHWQGLLSSVIGMAFGGGLVWAFRIVASGVMQQEALGFGDVTLMGMIGAYAGWQPSLLIFFIAPFAGAVIAICQLLLTRRKDIAYGPYLCFATLVLILNWNSIWERTEEYFLLGSLIPVGLLICLVALAVMLSGWLWIKSRLFGFADET